MAQPSSGNGGSTTRLLGPLGCKLDFEDFYELAGIEGELLGAFSMQRARRGKHLPGEERSPNRVLAGASTAQTLLKHAFVDAQAGETPERSGVP
jgi:hypothetical protein